MYIIAKSCNMHNQFLNCKETQITHVRGHHPIIVNERYSSRSNSTNCKNAVLYIKEIVFPYSDRFSTPIFLIMVLKPT